MNNNEKFHFNATHQKSKYFDICLFKFFHVACDWMDFGMDEWMDDIHSDTPTSSGPNSFGKTKQGFCDVKKIFEKSLRDFNNE